MTTQIHCLLVSVQARIAEKQSQMQGMIAENDLRSHQRLSPAYTEADFNAIAKEFADLANEATELGHY